MRRPRAICVLYVLTGVLLGLSSSVVGNTALAGAVAPRTAVANAATLCGGAADPYPDGVSVRNCTFDDEFSGSTLNRSKWSAVTTESSNYHNNPLECFVDSPSTISVSSGSLHLTTRKVTSRPCVIPHAASRSTPVISGSVSSVNTFAQRYGVFSIRAKFPAVTAAGLHSALWMWPVDPQKYGPTWPISGELDIAEFFSAYPGRAIPYMHYRYDPSTTSGTATGSTKEGYSITGVNVATNNYCMFDPRAFHTYTMIWTPTIITIKIDDRTCLQNQFRAYAQPAGAPFDQPFFMILTQALGAAGTGNAPTSRTPTTATTLVDYVRVWQ